MMLQDLLAAKAKEMADAVEELALECLSDGDPMVAYRTEMRDNVLTITAVKLSEMWERDA